MSSEIGILQAKVVVLEILVRALFRDAFLNDDAPVEALDAFAARLSKRLQDGLGGESDAVWIMVSEQLNAFVDQLRHELQVAQDRKS